MATKKNELEELKKRQSAVLSGNGLSAVKAASAGTADKKAVANSIANEHDAAENVRANQQAVKSQQAKQIAAAHDQQENKPVSGAARRAQQIAAAHDAAENIRARQQRQAVKTAQDIANAHDFRENTRSAGAMSPAAKKAELSLQDIWQRAKAQGDAQKAAEAHKSAEALRALFGFSGGQDGGRVIETARPNLADGEQEQLVNQALRAIALEPGVIDYKSTREPEAPGTKQEQTIVGRILSTFTGGLKGSGAGFINAAGTFAEAQAARGGGVMDEDAALAEQELEGLRANLSDPSLTDEERKWVEQEIAMREQRIQNAELAQRSREGTTRETYALADRVAQSGQEDLARAKEGMGTLGKFLVDVGAAGVQFGADLATGSAGLSMALRSYGGGAQEARQEGASHEQQIVYGAANAALERLTEQISSVGNIKTKAFGAGALDDIGKGVIQAVEELGKTAAGKAVLNRAATAGVNFLSEGLEEAVSEAVTPLLKRAIYSSEPIDLAETAKSAAYSFLVGGALGGVLGGIGGTDTRTEAEPEAVQVPETQTIGREERLANAIAKRGGAEITYVDELPGGENAVYIDGKITVSRKKLAENTENTVLSVAMHEVTHHIETSGAWGEIRDFARKYTAEQGVDVDGVIEMIREEYGAERLGTQQDAAEREFVAKFCEEYLSDEQTVRRLARENRTLFERIRDALHDIYIRLRGTEEQKAIQNLIGIYDRALDTVGENPENRIGGGQYLFVRAEDTNKAEQMEQDGAERNVIWRENDKTDFRTLESQKQYREAIERGDMVSAQEILRKKAEREGYSADDEWRMKHRAPNASDGYSARMDDLSQMFGDDIYGRYAQKYFGTGEDYDAAAIAVIQRVYGEPESKVTVYRAIPDDVKDVHLRNGDWVSLTAEYAKAHGERTLDGKFRVIEETVPAKDLYGNGDSIHEFGYDNGAQEVYKNAYGNAKMIDVTYDDYGHLIPLSRRFDGSNPDKRYSYGSSIRELNTRLQARRAAENGLNPDREIVRPTVENRNPGTLRQGTWGENEVRPQEETKNTANQEMVEKPEAKGGKAGYLYRNIVSGQAEIEKFAGAQKRANRNAVNTEDLAQMSRSVGGTVDTIAGTALVDRKGDKIGKSWKETVGKLSKEESERLNLYRQHLHNIDRMSLQAKAGEKLAEVRKQIAEFKAQHTGIDQHTEAELAEFEHNYDLSPAVRESARDYLALLQKEKDLAAVRNKPVLAKNNGKGEMIPYTAEESRAEVKAMLEEHPELAEQAKAAEAFHDQFIREWAIGSGLMSEEQYNAIHEKYPHYVQSFRVDHMKTGSDSVTRKGGVNTSNPIRKAVGDITEIVPFEDAEMMQVNSIVRMARRNELFRNIYDFAKANPKDAAPYVRVLDAETDAKANVDTDIETVTETLEQGAMQATGDGYILTAMVDGKPVKMEVNADFYAGLQNLYGQDRGAVNDFLAGTVGKATTAFKQVTTGYNPWFPITNFAKDIQTGYINTISDAPTFINYVGEIGGAMIDMKRGSDDWKAFRALGGRDSGYYHNEKGFTASDRATRVESVKDVPHAAWEKTKELLSFVGENGEAIMRFAEYKAGVKKYGNTQEGRAKAIQAAADVTVNFSRSAPAAKTAENFVPYLNASIQGLDKMYRQAKEHPVKTTRRNLEMLTVSTLLLWMVNKDDEDYENLNNRTKDNYFCIPVGRIAEGMGIDDNLRKYGIEVEGKFLKIPKSREWSAVFSALFERYLRTIVKTKDVSDDSVKGIISRLIGRDEAESTDKAYRGIGTQLLTNIAPSNPVTDNILKTIFIDLPNNKDFAGRDIVPQRLQGLSPENQYDYTTSDVGKAVAKGWNAGADAVNRVPGLDVPKLAPVQADYLIDSNLGFVGDLLLAAGSDKSALSYFGDTFAQKFTADPKYQNGATDYFYEILDAAETAKNDANLAEGITSRMKTPEEFYYSELNSYKNEISELRKQEREILSGNMSKQEQERRVREIRQQIIEIANEAPGKAQEALETYKKTYIPEISHLSDEKQEAARKAHDELGLAYNDFVRFTDDYAQYVKETMGQEKDTEADVAEMLRGYKSLTDEQRDALYQVYSDNMEKNPFHVSKYEAEMDQTIGLYAEMTEAGRMRIRALLNDYEQDINDGKAEAGKLDGWKAKAYMAEQEAGITPEMYSQYRIALEIANTDGNTNYSQEEAERAVRMLNGLSNEQMAYLFASTNSQWKKNPFGSAAVSKYETDAEGTGEKMGADEYLIAGSSLLGALTEQTSETKKKSNKSSKTSSKPKKLKNLDNLKVLKPLKNLF